MTKYTVGFTTSKINYHEEQNIFLAPMKDKSTERTVESDKDLFQILYDLRSKHPDETIISISRERERSTDDNRESILLGYGHKNRELLLDANNMYWDVPSAKFITLYTKDIYKTSEYYIWVLREKDIRAAIVKKCIAMSTWYKDHVVESVEEARARMNSKDEIIPSKKEKAKETPKLVKSTPRKKKKKKKEKKKKEDRDYESANKPAPIKKLHGTKKERLAQKEKSLRKGTTPKRKEKSDRKKPKNPPTVQKPKRKLAKHQEHLERKHRKKLEAINLAEIERMRKETHRKEMAFSSWNEEFKQLPSEEYNTPRTDTTVLTGCERKYLHYLNLAKGLEAKCEKALTELNRYKALVEKYKVSKSEKKQEKAVNMEKNIIPVMVSKYRKWIDMFEDASRLKDRWHKKVEELMSRSYEAKKKYPTSWKPFKHPQETKIKRDKHATLVCMLDNNDGSITRMLKDDGDKLYDKDSERYTYSSKEAWKAWKKKQRKGEWKSGVIQISHGRPNRDKITKNGLLLKNKQKANKKGQPGELLIGSDFAHPKFERGAKRMSNRAEQQSKQITNVFGAMPRTRVQKVTTKVKEVSKSGTSTEAFHVYAQDAQQFTFKSNLRKIVKDENGKLFFKNLNPVVVEFRVGKRVLLETRKLNYNYVKPASTITKTIIHKSTYTDCTSMTTNLKPIKRRKNEPANRLNRKAKYQLRKKRQAKRKNAKQ